MGTIFDRLVSVKPTICLDITEKDKSLASGRKFINEYVNRHMVLNPFFYRGLNPLITVSSQMHFL